jgi:hypothetical protein
MFRTRNVVLTLALALALTRAAHAQGYGSSPAGPDLSDPTVRRAMSKLESARTVRGALAFVHFGDESRGASVVRVTHVSDPNTGAVLPGWFCCTVRYHWNFLGKTGWSEMHYYYTTTGKYHSHRTGATTASLLKHFSEANVARFALKTLVLSLVDDNLARGALGWLIDSVSIPEAFNAYMEQQFP